LEFGCRTSWWGRASSPARSIGDTSNFSARQLRASLDVVVGVGSLEDECSSYRGLWQARQQTKDVFTFTFTTRRNCCRSRASPARPQTQQRAALLQSLRGTMPALAAQAARNELHDSQWIPPLSVFRAAPSSRCAAHRGPSSTAHTALARLESRHCQGPAISISSRAQLCLARSVICLALSPHSETS